jgi:glycosyltransferase involved in cell wall biosynthesis
VRRDVVHRIFIDAAIIKPRLGGIRTYILSLTRALHERDDTTVVVATSEPDEFSEASCADIVELPAATQHFVRRAAWRESNLNRLARRTQSDLILVPYPEMTMRRPPIPSIMVVHDVRALAAPRYETTARRARFRAALGPACRRASHVVCVSEFTLLSLHACVRVDSSKVSVIGEAPSQRLTSVGAAATKRSHARPFVVYVGSMLPHKNVDVLVQAAALGIDCDLLLVGPASISERHDLDSRARALGCGGSVRHLGWLAETELAHLLGQAEAVLLPSLYEGYGLPVIEAMHAGVPVLASDLPVFREVCENYPGFIDRPLDPVAWQHAMKAPNLEALRWRAANNAHQATIPTWGAVANEFALLFGQLAAKA